jgi:hypothetical protein
MTRYEGKIFPANVTFNSPNFKYIKTVKGVSNAAFSGYGWDRKRADGMVNEAKRDLYNQLSLKENQAPTNFTLDFVRIGTPNYHLESMVLRQVRAVLTADIFEFSNNGVYSVESENTQMINQNINDNLPKDNEREQENEVIQNINESLIKNENLNISLSNKLKIGYKSIDNYTKLRGGYEVLYYDGKNHFVGKVKFKNSLGKYTITEIKKYNEINNIWEQSEIESSSVDLSEIIGYKN